MLKEFLVYWRPEQVRAAITDGLLDHAASEQFGRVASGDTLWITGKGARDPLVTVGPLDVAEIVGQREAKRRLPYEPWPATHHALAAPGASTVTREVSLSSILEGLEFVSTSSQRLDLTKPIGLQLQTIRQLTDTSAKKIRELWGSASRASTTEFDEIQDGLDSYAELDQRRVVFVRREQSFLRQYLFRDNETGLCSICREDLPVSLLVAAHIKPRAKCSDIEKRDYANNVLPMCLLGCDALFERGLLVVEDGKVRVRLSQNTNDRLCRLLKHLDGRSTHVWKAGRVKYFNWHAEQGAMHSN